MDFANKETYRLIALGVIALLAGAMMLRVWLKPKQYPQGNSLKRIDENGPFTIETIKMNHAHSIWCNHVRQEFVVLDILPGSDWFYIGAYPPGDRRLGRKRRFTFRGWTQGLCHRTFIERSHLADAPPCQLPRN